MSSTSVCQGLQSCLEPRLVEPRVLKLRLAPPPPKLKSSSSSKPFVSNFDPLQESQNELQNTSSSNKLGANNGGWSFLQALSNTSESSKTEKVYVHPLVKRSSSLLSKKSLEMCTESLGSETGSDVSESSYNSDIALLSVENEKFPTQSSGLSAVWSPPPPQKRLNRSSSFPPPLTSISGSVGLQVRPHRQEGRLVLEAVTVSSPRTYFHAERADGRLRLRIVKNLPPSYHNDAAENQEVEEEEDDEEEDEEEEEEEEMGMSIGADEEQVAEVEGVDENELAENENNEAWHGEEDEEETGEEEMEENSGNVRGEMGMEKLSRPSRCKEGGRGKKRLMNWEPFCVAT